MLDTLKPDAVGGVEVNGNRASPAIECAKRGIPLLSDKPLVTHLKELTKLERIASRNPDWLCSVAFSLRYSEEGQTIKSLLEKKHLGEIASFYGCRNYKLGTGRPAWMFDHQQYGGIIADIGSHDIDLIRWFFATEVIEATCISRNVRFKEHPDFRDSVQIFLRCDTGITALLDINWVAPDCQPGHERFTRIIGSAGILEHQEQTQNLFSLVTNDKRKQNIPAIESSRTVVGDFFDYCLGKPVVPLVTTPESFQSTRTALLVQQAADQNKTVKIMPPGKKKRIRK